MLVGVSGLLYILVFVCFVNMDYNINGFQNFRLRGSRGSSHAYAIPTIVSSREINNGRLSGQGVNTQRCRNDSRGVDHQNLVTIPRDPRPLKERPPLNATFGLLNCRGQ